jgi:4-alpha-glucanotransferase
MAEDRPALRELARSLGVEDGYHSALDGCWVETSDDARERLVAAMGFAAASESAAEAFLTHRTEQTTDAPARRCFDTESCLQGRSVFGIFANLYSVRSRRAGSAGFGNLGDLEDLVGLAASEGAAFVGINPLHATVRRKGRFCPYDPVSRLFRDPLYLDPERVPELALCPDAKRALGSRAWRERADALRRSDALDAEAIESVLFEVLRPLYATFRDREGAAPDRRRRAFADYREEQGPALAEFATFEALADHFEATRGGRSARDWPKEFQRSDQPAVARFRSEHAAEVEWHAWLQFELDRQLGAVARAAQGAGLGIGLYTDLALGSSAGGSDVWSSPQLFARGISVGAPPDAFCPEGQDWSFPPLDPHALCREGFSFWRRLLDANLRHAGALRIDHALALRRLFWIPEGATPRDGAYVRYPTADLLAVLTELSLAHRALLIAEDLGTVPEGFSEGLQAQGLLSSRVLLFERNDEGFLPSSSYPRRCLATANTHDLPPLAALASDTDLVLRRRVGQIPDDASLEERRQERSTERQLLGRRLAADGLLEREAGAAHAPPTEAGELAAAVTAFLCATPAELVGIALDDLAGEEEPINLPGVSSERHASWTRRMRAPLDSVFASSRARRIFARVSADRRSGRSSAARRS